MSHNKPDSPAIIPSREQTQNERERLIRRLLTVFGMAYVLLCLFLPEARRLGWVEVSILIAVLVINSDLQKFTLSRDSISIERRFESVEKKQEGLKQLNELLIKFVIDMLVTPREVSLLKQLAGDDPARYTNNDERQHAYLQYELRRLRSLYLIEEIPNSDTGKRISIGSMPQEGDLKLLFRITPRGSQFLELRQQLKAKLESKEAS